MKWHFPLNIVALLATTGAALAQVEPAVPTPTPSMPIFKSPAPAAPPPSTVERSLDADGHERDTVTTYRTGPFGTYTDHSTITTYPPGNPSLSRSNPH